MVSKQLSNYSKKINVEFDAVNKKIKNRTLQTKLTKVISENAQYNQLIEHIYKAHKHGGKFIQKEVMKLFECRVKSESRYTPFQHDKVTLLDNGALELDLGIDNRTPMRSDIFGEFTSKKFSNIVKAKCIISIPIEFTICTSRVTVCFHVLAKNFKSYEKRRNLLKRINRILVRIAFVIIFFKESTCSKPEHLVMNLFLININKKIPHTRDTILDTENINSGFTTFMGDGTKNIIIFRAEEMDKLIIHELIHFYYLDFHQLDVDLAQFLNVADSIKFIPNESYTETMTILIHCALLASETDGGKEHVELKPLKKTTVNFLVNEIMFGLFQCAKILYHYNYHNISNFVLVNNSNNRNNRNKSQLREYTNNFRQTACILSYYFVKTSLLVNFTSTLTFLNRNFIGPNNFKISDSVNVKQQYSELIAESLKRSDFTSHVQKYLKFITDNMLTKKRRRTIYYSCKKKKNVDNCVRTRYKSIKNRGSKFADSLLIQNQRMSLAEL